MAGRDESSKLKIISTLKRLRRPCTTLDLAKGLGVKRNEINPLLYELQRQGLIKKVQESNPPLWDLTEYGNTYGSIKKGVSTGQSSIGKGRGRGLLSLPQTPSISAQEMHLQTRPDYAFGQGKTTSLHAQSPFSFQGHSKSPTKQNQNGTQLRIIRVLEGSTKPLTALEVAKSLGLTTRKEVNPDLYDLQKKGVVSMDQALGPPVWTLIRNTDRRSPATNQFLDSECDVQMDSGAPPGDEIEDMDVQSGPSLYTSSSVDLSQISEDDMCQRLMAVMTAEPQLQRTELELREATGKKFSRLEIKRLLEQLLKEGRVKKTWGIPTKWKIADLAPQNRPPIGRGIGMQLNPHASPFTPLTATPPGGSASQPPPPVPLPLKGDTSGFSASVVNDMNRNPVSALTEHCQATKTELSFVEVREFGPPHKKHFIIAAVVGNETFEAESTNKKEAKRMAADLAFQTIQEKQVRPLYPTASSSSGTSSVNISNIPHAPHTFCDKIAELAHGFYTQVQRTIEFPQPGRKVIAAFIMENTLSGEMKVVSMGSGTRCITGDKMSLEGCVVNDSHAEVIARRSLMRFFYKHLLAYHQGNSVAVDTIFDASEGENLLKVKEKLKFHLYISTAPCGDGAQFSRGDDQNRDPPADNNHVPTMQNKLQGVLRTKMEGGEGTIPISADTTPQTWDGILQGGRLRTMSCSDKVGRWNVLGLQGSLLSLFMHPVYMSSLTLGSLHHHGHLSRAVCCRFGDIKEHLPTRFTVNHPVLGRVQGGDEMRRHTEKTSNFSLNWALGDEHGELVDGGNGYPVPPPGIPKVQVPSVPSRVSKISLFTEFLKLAQVCNRSELLVGKTYKEMKELAVAFQCAKKALYTYCEKRGYGVWMKKPVEEEQFDKSVVERLSAKSLT